MRDRTLGVYGDCVVKLVKIPVKKSVKKHVMRPMKKTSKRTSKHASKHIMKRSSETSDVSMQIVNQLDVVNATKKTVLHSAPRWAISSPSQAKGFMFERPANNAIIFVFSPPQKVSLHMWFVFGEIDVVGLDEQYVVVALKEHFKPWTFWSSQVPVAYIIELPAGTVAATRTILGDKLSLPSLPSK